MHVRDIFNGRKLATADNWYRSISTLVSADCRLPSCEVQVFIFINESEQTQEWLPFPVKVGAFWDFVTLVLGAFLFCLHSAVLQCSANPSAKL